MKQLDAAMMRALSLLLVFCLGTSLARNGRSPTSLLGEALDTDAESFGGRSLLDENHPELKTSPIEAVKNENDNSDLYGFLATVKSFPPFSSDQALPCAGTLIHADALLTAAACKDYFMVGSAVQFVGGESGTIRHVSPISQNKSMNTNSPQGSFDLLIVFLESESLAPTAVWQQATQNTARVKWQGYTSFTYESDRSLMATGMELVSSSICYMAFSNDLSRSPNADVDNLVCAAMKTSGFSAAVFGAPLLSDDNSLLGVAVSSSSNARCESIRDCTTDDQRLLWFASIGSVTDNIERALCSSSRFPLDSCPPPLATPLSTVDTTTRNLAASTSSRKQGVVSRLFAWLRQVFFGGSSSPGQPPVTALPAKPPTRAPVKPPNGTPVKPPNAAPIKPPNVVPANPPVLAPIKDPTRAPVKPPTQGPAKPLTQVPAKPPTRAPVKPPIRAPAVPRPSEFPSFEPTSFTIPPTPVPVRPPKSPIPPPPPMAPRTPIITPVLAPFPFVPLGAPTAPRLACWPPSPKCPGGRNLMQKFCLTQCVAEENVRRKRKAGWRCGDCS